MKDAGKRSVGHSLGWASVWLALACGGTAFGGNGVFISESYDPIPALTLGGWEGGAENVAREFVPAGVNGSMAVRLSGTLLLNKGYAATILYQDGLVIGNERATLRNTVLSFEVKVDRPGLTGIVMTMQSWGGFLWNYWTPALPATSSSAFVALGDYTPGKFKHVTVSLDSSSWSADEGWLPFLPDGKTYQIFLQVDAQCLPALGDFSVTMDNVEVSAGKDMVPWNARSKGQMLYTTPMQVAEAGNSEHLGTYTQTATFGDDGTAAVVITAANGAKLFGTLYLLEAGGNGGSLMVSISGGTGRFKGAAGSYRSTFTWDNYPFTFSGTMAGFLSSVGSNK